MNSSMGKFDGSAIGDEPCASLGAAILRHRLVRCYYLALRCRRHDEFRVAVEKAPADQSYPCPVCHAPCTCVVLGEGGTRRRLPFFDSFHSGNEGMSGEEVDVTGDCGNTELKELNA